MHLDRNVFASPAVSVSSVLLELMHLFHGAIIMPMILMATVARKRIDTANAAFLSFFLSMLMLILPWYGDSISEVMRSIMAVMARRRLMSQKFKGKDSFVSPFCFYSRRYSVVMVRPSSLVWWFSIITGLPAAFAIAHAIALQMGQPIEAVASGSFSVSMCVSL